MDRLADHRWHLRQMMSIESFLIRKVDSRTRHCGTSAIWKIMPRKRTKPRVKCDRVFQVVKMAVTTMKKAIRPTKKINFKPKWNGTIMSRYSTDKFTNWPIPRTNPDYLWKLWFSLKNSIVKHVYYKYDKILRALWLAAERVVFSCNDL